MDYETFDMGNFDCETTKKIMELLSLRPRTANELAHVIFQDGYDSYKISPKLQKLKSLGMISNVKDSNNACYWGATKKYRQNLLSQKKPNTPKVR